MSKNSIFQIKLLFLFLVVLFCAFPVNSLYVPHIITQPITNPYILQCRGACRMYYFCDCINSSSYLSIYSEYWTEAVKNKDILLYKSLSYKEMLHFENK